MKKVSKLIVLRGPSGAGKSSVAKKLFDLIQEPAVLIQQDHYRFIFKPSGGGVNSKAIHKMVKANVLSALEDGYDVLLEGIFNAKSFQKTFKQIFTQHSHNNYSFYFDISFEETLRRHATKPDSDTWGEKEMREWYSSHDYLGYDFEWTILEQNTLDQTVEYIKQKANI